MKFEFVKTVGLSIHYRPTTRFTIPNVIHHPHRGCGRGAARPYGKKINRFFFVFILGCTRVGPLFSRMCPEETRETARANKTSVNTVV